MKKFETKDYINYALSFAGIAVTVALIVKPEKIEVIKNEYFVPMRELVQVEKQEEKVVTVTQAIEEVKKEVPVTPKVAPVTPVKEEVKKEPAKEVVQEVKAEPVQENPFEVVRYSVDEVTSEKTGNEEYIRYVTLKASAYHRQGSLASLQKLEVRYFVEEMGEISESTSIVSKNYDTTVLRSGENEFKWKAIYGKSEYANFTMKVKIYAFTNNGGDITYGESDWIEVK